MRLQIYMSPMLSERLCKEALDKQMKPCELADQILKDHFGIREDKEDYQKALHYDPENITIFYRQINIFNRLKFSMFCIVNLCQIFYLDHLTVSP